MIPFAEQPEDNTATEYFIEPPTLSKEAQLSDFLMFIPNNFIYVAFFGWSAVIIGLARHLISGFNTSTKSI